MPELPTPGSLFGAIVFGAIGMGAFFHGMRRGLAKPMILGVVLMIYPYFISDGTLVFVIGAALSYLLYLFRE